MARFSDLPNELLFAIFYASPTVRTAWNLSRSCVRTHDIWTTYDNEIISEIVHARLPAPQDAMRLATLQTTGSMVPPAHLRTIIGPWLQHLEFNARHASQVWLYRINPMVLSGMRTPLPEEEATVEAYYKIRQLSVALGARDKLEAIVMYLDGTTLEQLHGYIELTHWLCTTSDLRVTRWVPVRKWDGTSAQARWQNNVQHRMRCEFVRTVLRNVLNRVLAAQDQAMTASQ